MDVSQLGNGTEASTGIHSDRVETPDEKRSRLQREYRQKNHARIREIERKSHAKRRSERSAYANKWNKAHRDHVRERQRKWRENNREKLRANYKAYHAKNKEKRSLQSKQFRERHAERLKAKAKENRQNNRAKNSAYEKAWWAAHPEKLKEKYDKYYERRMQLKRLKRLNDPNQKIIDACRTRVRFIILQAGVKKMERTFELVGCTPDFFRKYMESQFTYGMCWENYGKWEIDHRVPVSRYDMTQKAQRLAAFHYSNCQPLWQSENRSKCDNFIGPVHPTHIWSSASLESSNLCAIATGQASLNLCHAQAPKIL